MSAIEIVERPTMSDRLGRKISAETQAVIDTANSGKAVRIALNGTGIDTLRNRFVATAKRRGLRVHQIQTGDGHVVVWAERKP